MESIENNGTSSGSSSNYKNQSNDIITPTISGVGLCAVATNDDKNKNDNGSTNTTGLDNSDDNHSQAFDQAPAPSMSKLIRLAQPEWFMLLIAICMMICAEGADLINPILLGRAYDDLVDVTLDSSQRMNQLNQTMVYIILLHGGAMVGTFIRVSILMVIGERIVARLRVALYKSILHQEIGFFDRHQSGEMVSRLGSDTALLQQGSSTAVPEVFIGITKVIISISLMFWISPKLAMLTTMFVLFVVLAAVPFGVTLGTLSKSYQNVLGDAQSFSTEALQAMRTVQSFSAQSKEVNRYESKIGNPSLYKYWYPLNVQTPTTYSVGYFKSLTTSGLITIIFGLGFGGMYITLWYGFKLVNDNEITIGQLTAFQSYIFTIGASLGSTSHMLANIFAAHGVAGRVFYLLERIPEIPKQQSSPPLSDIDQQPTHYPIQNSSSNNNQNIHNKNEPSSDRNNHHSNITLKNRETHQDEEMPLVPLKPIITEGAIHFHDVTFFYPSRPGVTVLQNFTLSIPANQTTAIVGASGSGKSTCIALLQRFYDVTSGTITLDGYDIEQMDLNWLRQQMAYVQQEPQLFGLSIKENILYGIDPNSRTSSAMVSDEDIYEIARTANAHDFIMQWPNKYETLVGERGVKLSGGQKQRIAIARALMRKPRILLLDEATSALDAESEHLVQQAIDNAIVGRTVVVVAHRLSTIQRAHQIVVIDQNHIMDVGTHNELLQRCTKYQDLIKRQKLLSTSINGEEEEEEVK